MTKFQKIAAILCVACTMIIVTAVCCFVSYHNGYKAGWRDCRASIQVDTTQHTDTSSFVNPEPVVVEPAASVPAGYVQVKAGTIAQLKARIAELEAAAATAPADSSAAPVEDLPVEVTLPIERKVYQDSTYRAVVEGVQARLAEIQTFNTTTTITNIVKDPVLPKFILSPVATASFDPGGVLAGVGVSVDAWVGRWQFGAEAGYGIRLDKDGQAPGVYARAVAKYNLFKK